MLFQMLEITDQIALTTPEIKPEIAFQTVETTLLIASITVREDRTIPVTFILVAVLYIGQQVYQGIFQRDNISQMAHIAGGAVGEATSQLEPLHGITDYSEGEYVPVYGID